MITVGAQFGHFEVTARLGAGGMGEVWRATDARLGREVALKLLPGDFPADPERHVRLEREARTLASLSHPNIATLYGLEHADGQHVLVMELVEGEGLDAVIARGPLPVEEALPVARRIAAGLEAAHAKGIVHRDLKPANVKLGPDGEVKILDFGLARAYQGDGGAESDPGNSPTLSAAMTAAGTILGTAAYMSPEQARGKRVDRRADIWAFGVVLWEMLTGRGLFAGESVSDTLAAVLRADIDLAALPPATPPPIRRLLRRCLERDPRNRLHDIADARIVIDEVLSGRDEAVAAESAPATPAPVGWRRLLPWLAGGLVGLVLGAVGVWQLAPPREPPGAGVPRIGTLVSGGEPTSPALSPDGRTLAFVSFRNDQPEIWLKDLASGSESVLVARPSADPDFSPDGTSLVYAVPPGQRQDLYRITLATREERLVARNAGKGAWAPDGRRIAFLRPGPEDDSRIADLTVIDVESGRERQIHRFSAAGTGDRPVGLRWSGDGRRIAVGIAAGMVGVGDRIALVDVASGSVSVVPIRIPGLPGIALRGLAWLDRDRVALLLQDDWGTVTSAGRLAILDLATGRARSVMPLQPVLGGLVSAGPGAVVVGLGANEQSLFEMRRDGTGGWEAARQLTEGPSIDRQPIISPDGRWLLYTSNRSGNLDIWRLERDTGALDRLTDSPAEDWDPALSPDGSKLLFSSNRSGRFQIWMAAADGSSPRQVTDLENAQNPTMTRDGQWITFVRQDAGEQNGIWRIHPDGSDAARIDAGAVFLPEIDPSGEVVAYVSPPPRGLRIARIADGTQLTADAPGTQRLRWTVEGGRTYLWVLGLDDPNAEVPVLRRFPLDRERGALGPAEPIPTGDGHQIVETFGVAADGSAVVLSATTLARAQIVRIDGLGELGGR